MNMIKEDISKLNIKINEVADLFYKQFEEEANAKLNLLLYDIENTINNIVMLENIDFDTNALNSSLNEAVNAMINKDNILLADILKYELTSQFDHVQELL